LVVAAITLNKTGVFILLIIVGGVIGASALFLMTPKPAPKLENHVIMTILDEGINQENLQIQYDEKTPQSISLERTINCIEVEKEQQTLVFMETIELKIENVSFTDTVGDGTGDMIVVSFTNVGTNKVIFVQVNFNYVTQTGNWELASGENAIGAGLSDTVQITADWTAGNKYSIQFFATDGKVVSPLFTTVA